MNKTYVSDLLQYLDSVAPFRLQESYDNSGLLTGSTRNEITGVMTSLDMTEEVIDEAIELNCNVVVAHHPIIFTGLKQVTGKTYVERIVIKAIKNDINLIAIHTNLDNVLQSGVNERIAKQLGLEELTILSPKLGENIGIGAGIIGNIPEALDTEQLLKLIKTKLQCSAIKYTHSYHDKYMRIAICGGSGSFLLDSAKHQKADCFITSDFKYHEFFDAENEIMICDIGHYETEQFTANLLQELIQEKFSTFAAHCTKAITNPVNYYF